MAVSQDIGTAKMSLTLDTTDYDIAVERSKQKQAGLGETAKAEAEKMTRAQRQVIQSLENQANRIGLTREQWLQYKVITQTTGETQKALLARIQANTAALEKEAVAVQKTVNARNAYGLTQKQEVAALRQVPAQLTDIFVSLQGGQNPLTVLLQQGGQLRDVFGGAVPAVRALGGAVAGLVNPVTLTLGALAAVGAAAMSNSRDMDAFNASLVTSGRYAADSAQQLLSLRSALDDMDGVTSGIANDVVNRVVSGGKISEELLNKVSTAAAAWASVTGKSVDDVVSAYERLAKDPLNAINELNAAEHFLTIEQQQRIATLQEEGQWQEAATLALTIYADTHIQRAGDIESTLSNWARLWRGLKDETSNAWQEFKGFADWALGVGASLQANNALLLKNMFGNGANTLSDDWNAVSGWAKGLKGALWNQPTPNDSAATNAAASAELATMETAKLTAERLQIEKRNLTDQQKLQAEKTRIQEIGKKLALGDKWIAEQTAAAEAAAAKKNRGGGASAMANAGASAALQAIKDQETTQRAEIANTSKVLQAEYAARLVTQTDYYRQQRELVTRDQAAQEQSLVKQIEYLRSRDVAGKDSINVSKQLGELEARLAKVRADGATQLVILGIQEQDVAEKRQRAIDGYKESLQTANEAAQRSADASLARIIMGEREAAQQEKIAQVLADSAEKQRQLNREFAENNDVAAYEEKLAALQEYTDTQVRIVEEGYRRMREAESDWLNGLQGGIAQWMEGAANVAQQTNSITQRGLDNITQAFVNFATTGKSQWKSLLADIGTEIVKFMAKQAVMQFIQLFASYWTGGMSTNNGSLGMTDLGNSNWTMAANGGVFNGAKGLSAYSGTVVSQPTPFYFAKGAGIMGEAGDEGIFPLARGADGKLGVKAMGAGGGMGDVYINVTTNVASDGSTNTETRTAGGQAAMYRELGETMAQVAQREITKAMMPGGQIWKNRGGS